MPRIGRRQRLATMATWPVGIALTSWDYLWRTTPIHRLEFSGLPAAHTVDPAVGDDVQGAGDGVGPLFHRRYTTQARDTSMSPEALMSRLTDDIKDAAPTSFARFVRTRGERGSVAVGDEFVVRMPGPWDGPVRVVAADVTSFTLATLEGHMEAGQIRFSAARGEHLEFRIEAFARSGDRLSNVLYHHLRMAKEVQLHMWVSFLERIVRLSGGRMTGGIDIKTWRVEDPRSGSPAALRELAALRDRPFNFDPAAAEPRIGDTGWRIDDLCEQLPAEPPGPVLEHGSFATARELLRTYAFADPAVVRAHYDPEQELAGRNMLLEIHFHGLRFLVGVRVLEVYDRTVEIDGREAQLAGWSYGTLEGHFEAGKLEWQVWKWLDTGEVQFRTHAYSRRAPDPNLITRAGFRIVGRREQLSFMHGTRRRMASLTAVGLEDAARR